MLPCEAKQKNSSGVMLFIDNEFLTHAQNGDHFCLDSGA